MFAQCSTWNAVIASEAAVGSGDAARNGLEIEQVAEAGEPLEFRFAGEAFGGAAVAEEREWRASGHGIGT